MKIKIKDIAYLAGVSPAAVSLALNNKGRISSATRQKILEVARQYAYIDAGAQDREPQPQDAPDAGAVAAPQPGADAKTLAILSHYKFPSYTNGFKKQFFHELCDAMQDEAMRAGFRTSISFLDDGESDILRSDAFAGFIIFASTMTSQEADLLLRPLVEAHRPFLLCDKFFPDRPYECVVADNWYGGYLAGAYIARHGFRDVGYFRCDMRIDNFEKRHLGFVAALREANLQLDPQKVYTLSADPDKCREQVAAIIEADGRLPEAVFAESDYLAIDAIQVLAEHGVAVPDDVSIIGFDNIHSASLVTPGLTTVAVRKRALARTVISRIVARIGDPALAPQKIYTPVRLIERRSFRKRA